MADLLDMGKYGVFIWTSYGASVLVIGGLIVWIVGQRRKARAHLRDLEHKTKGMVDQ